MYTLSGQPPSHKGWVRPDYDHVFRLLKVQVEAKMIVHLRSSRTALRKLEEFIARHGLAWHLRRIPGGLEIMDCWGL